MRKVATMLCKLSLASTRHKFRLGGSDPALSLTNARLLRKFNEDYDLLQCSVVRRDFLWNECGQS